MHKHRNSVDTTVNILVTGAAGFIGSKVSQSLVKLGHRIIAVDNFNNYYSSALKRARVESLLKPLGVDVINLDICKRKSILDLIATKQPEIVLHFAAQAGIRLPNEQVSKYVDSNLVGFSNILLATIQSEIPNFMYASSSSVYGDSLNFPFSEKDLTLRPISFYGATKLANEILTPTLVKNSATKARGLRFFTVYGPWGRPDMAYFRLINAALNKKQFHLFGDGTIVRDFTYVDDVVNSILQLMEDLMTRAKGFHDVVNIAGGKPASLKEMISEISVQLNEEISIRTSEMHNNDVPVTSADTTYLRSLIPHIPTTSLRFGLAEVINWGRQPNFNILLEDWVQSSI